MSDMLHVVPLRLEATRFLVQSESLECEKCQKMHSNARRRVPLQAGDACTKFGCNGTLDRHYYMVDLAHYGGLGKCDCHEWSCRVWVKVKALKPAQWIAVRHWSGYRCKHLEAAIRFYAMLKLDQDRARQGMARTRNREHAGE